ncbi:hypothetical protein CDAR_201061 [Caerostris darwini]|uniref:Uncharacterized protein n=1 Tax=Caerostris darwini TaxID=1538125 RepID=A0AAV4P4L8_9ARAC|nr:hypothetical protein CDAR_201061 [Caerostris darwini]
MVLTDGVAEWNRETLFSPKKQREIPLITERGRTPVKTSAAHLASSVITRKSLFCCASITMDPQRECSISRVIVARRLPLSEPKGVFYLV